jgi:uncharacterized membrane protein
MMPWPGLAAVYSNLYKSASTFLFESFGSNTRVRFEQSNNSEHDIKIVFYSLGRAGQNGNGQPFRKNVVITSRYSAYIYTAFMIALILATPVSWKRKAWALLWGMTLLHCFLVFKMAVLILYVLAYTPHCPVIIGPFWKTFLLYAHQAFLKNMVFCFLISVLIWLLVSFRKKEWVNTS